MPRPKALGISGTLQLTCCVLAIETLALPADAPKVRMTPSGPNSDKVPDPAQGVSVRQQVHGIDMKETFVLACQAAYTRQFLPWRVQLFS